MSGKLVRDRIPEIIVKNGDTPSTRILTEAEYLKALDSKLQEEVAEYLECNDLAELADVLEVVRAIADARGTGIDSIEHIRMQKLKERGGFKDKIYLYNT